MQELILDSFDGSSFKQLLTMHGNLNPNDYASIPAGQSFGDHVFETLDWARRLGGFPKVLWLARLASERRPERPEWGKLVGDMEKAMEPIQGPDSGDSLPGRSEATRDPSPAPMKDKRHPRFKGPEGARAFPLAAHEEMIEKVERRAPITLGVSLILALMLVTGLYWHWEPGEVGPDQHPPKLTSAGIYRGRPGTDTEYEYESLLSDPTRGLVPFRSGDVFKLELGFDRETHWALLWIDPLGRVSLCASSKQPEREFTFPAIKRKMSEFKSHDPLGENLLLLLVADQDLTDHLGPIGQTLGTTGPPPIPLAGREVQVRGDRAPPDQVHVADDPASDFYYLRAIDTRLPHDVTRIFALFLRLEQ